MALYRADVFGIVSKLGRYLLLSECDIGILNISRCDLLVRVTVFKIAGTGFYSTRHMIRLSLRGQSTFQVVLFINRPICLKLSRHV